MLEWIYTNPIVCGIIANAIFWIIGFVVKKITGMTSKMFIIIGIGVVIISLTTIIAFLYFQNKELQLQNEELQRTAILPKDYEFTDVQSYVTDESTTTIELLYDENKNLYRKYTLYFKVKGGVEDTYKIFHNFGIGTTDSKNFSGFKLKNVSANKKITLDHFLKSNEFDLQINFSDGDKLKKGEVVEYEIEIINKAKIGSELFYFKLGELGYNIMKIIIKFPIDIEPQEPDYTVFWGKSEINEVIIPKEVARLKKDNINVFNKNDNSINLVVNKPIIGLKYKLYCNLKNK